MSLSRTDPNVWNNILPTILTIHSVHRERKLRPGLLINEDCVKQFRWNLEIGLEAHDLLYANEAFGIVSRRGSMPEMVSQSPA